jgi:hypothetical protein
MHTAVFSGRSSHISPVTRGATTSLITSSVSPSCGRSMGPSLYRCRPKTGRERGYVRLRPKYTTSIASPSSVPRRPRHFAAMGGGGVVSSAAGAVPRSPSEKP